MITLKRTFLPLVAKCLADTLEPEFKAAKMASSDLFLQVRDKDLYEKFPELALLYDTLISVT